MLPGITIQSWRNKRGLSIPELAQLTQLSPEALQELENGQVDPPASMLAVIADAFGIPVPWLYGDPGQLDALVQEESEGPPEKNPELKKSVDPVLEHILRADSVSRNLFHLLALLIHTGEEKQIRAAEVSLKSLIKKTRGSIVPWENRQPGNFDPPSD